MAASVSTISLFLDGIMAGLFLGSAMVEHAERTLGASEWIAYKQAKERFFGPMMPALFGVTLLSSIVTATLPPLDADPIVVAVLLTAALVITVVVHLPLNKEFQRWSPSCFPETWSKGRRRWRQWNWARTLLVVLAFAIALTARH